MATKTWIRVTVDAGRANPAAVEAALTGLGALATALSDAADDPVLEPAPGTTPLWPSVSISAWFDTGTDETAIRLVVAAAAGGEAMSAIRFETVDERDWIEDWRRSLKPLRFGSPADNEFWVCPAGQVCPEKDAAHIELEPGLAFGSGEHPTTALCLDWLAVDPDPRGSLLDYGCGSGILGIAALALGARDVYCVDIDPQALQSTRNNAARNGFADRLVAADPVTARPAGPFDRIVANILSNTLVELAGELRRFSRTGTRIALTGILTDQADTVLAAYRDWVAFTPATPHGDWLLLSGTVNV